MNPKDHQMVTRADLVCIDEAAAIPMPHIKKLFGSHHVFMSSTVDGFVSLLVCLTWIQIIFVFMNCVTSYLSAPGTKELEVLWARGSSMCSSRGALGRRRGSTWRSCCRDWGLKRRGSPINKVSDWLFNRWQFRSLHDLSVVSEEDNYWTWHNMTLSMSSNLTWDNFPQCLNSTSLALNNGGGDDDE